LFERILARGRARPTRVVRPSGPTSIMPSSNGSRVWDRWEPP